MSRFFKNIPTYLFDLDGTLMIEDTPAPYVPELIDYLNRNEKEFFIVTNGALLPVQISEKFRKRKIKVKESNIITTAEIISDFLYQHYRHDKVFVIGAGLLKEFLSAKHFRLSEVNPKVVVVSYDSGIDFTDVEKGIRFIAEGADFISANDDIYIPGKRYDFPHTGVINAAIASVSEKTPYILGKPRRYFFEAIKKRTGQQDRNFCIVGDNLLTDIGFGKNCNIASILVLTGVTSKEEAESSSIKPDEVIDNIGVLLELEAARQRDIV